MTFRYTGSGAGLRRPPAWPPLLGLSLSPLPGFLCFSGGLLVRLRLSRSSTACFLTFQAGVVFTTTVFA
jgi:hypothetical protein